VHTARVPLITGNVEQLYDELTQFLKKINKDSFMKSSVIGLHVKNKNNIEVQLRNNDFKVLFGNTKDAEKKFMNLKAFYQKAKRDDLLSVYETVDLKYGSQVVATKK
jgi:cell division protein FtsQ